MLMLRSPSIETECGADYVPLLTAPPPLRHERETGDYQCGDVMSDRWSASCAWEMGRYAGATSHDVRIARSSAVPCIERVLCPLCPVC